MIKPSEALQLIDKETLEGAFVRTRTAPRRREMIVLNQPEDVVQRMVNVVQPDSYLPPHRHVTPEKFEVFMPMCGAIAVFIFEDSGDIAQCNVLRPEGPQIIADVLPPAWHTYIALEPDTAVFEAKQGPYDPAADKDFAPWAPKEETAEAPAYLKKLRSYAENV